MRIGVVAIGRNEGERLKACLESLRGQMVVYVDSGSTDDSVALARQLGATVVNLDLSIPFTAARARNAGLAKLLELQPGLCYVQFVDGDCIVNADWLDQAADVLDQQRDVAVVCGRRRERYPEHSIYNLLCDIEWNTPIGEANACGGDALMRIAALQSTGRYDESLIAGEEPELCVRLRRARWRILRMDAEMTLHDAAMTRFSQWWKRSKRAGYAFAQGAAMHGKTPERHWIRETRSIWFWGIILPLIALIAAWPTSFLSLLLLVAYPLLLIKIYRYQRKIGLSRNAALAYAYFCVIGKFAQAAGVLRYHIGQFSARPAKLIEYKSTSATCQVTT